MPLKRFLDGDLSVYDLLQTWPDMAPVFYRHHMVCVGCLVSRFHTLPDVCAAYGLNLDAFCFELTQELIVPPRPTR